VWDEVQEALSTMEHEEFVETAEADLKVSSIATLFGIIPSVSAVLGCV
jgi:hypothetical protein